MSKYLRTAAMTILVLGTIAFAQAQTANEQTISARGGLTSEQENAIYVAVTEGIRERDPPALRLGDELPWWAQVRPLPDSLRLKSVKGFLYAIVPTRSAVGFHNEVFLIDPFTNKVVRIIRKPLTFQF